MKIPKTFMGERIEDILRQPEPDAQSPEAKGEHGLTNLIDPKNWIFLQSRQHGIHEYPDLYVCLHRLGYDAKVEEAVKKAGLDFNPQNSATHSDNVPYIGNINYGQAMRLAKAVSYPLSLRTGVDFLKEIRDGSNGTKVVYDGNRTKIDNKILETAYEEIVKVRKPWRSEWFSDRFGENTITFTLIKPDGTTQEITESLESCLMEDKKLGIDLNAWLQKANSQGLPIKKTAKGDLYYWHPVNGSVARFDANSGRAYLNCYWDAGYSDVALGVRLVALAPEKN